METQSVALALPNRPQNSANFKNICSRTNLVTNMYPIRYIGKDKMYIYSAEITPEISQDSRQLREKIFKQIEGQIRKDFPEKDDKRIFQGFNMISFYFVDKALVYTTREIQGQTYSVKLTKVKDVVFKDLDNLGQGNVQTMILNSFIKDLFKQKNYVEFGKLAKYNAMWKAPVDMSGIQGNLPDLYVWRGFKTSSFLCPESQFLQIDFTSRVVRDETGLQLINFYKGLKKTREEIETLVEGKTVITDYGNNRAYRIDQIDWSKTPQDTFEKKGGEKISYIEYFQEQYGKKIKDINQPMFISRDKKRRMDIYLPPELVLLTGLEDEEKANFKVMQAISKYTKLTPRERMHQIEGMADELASMNSGVLEFVEDHVPTVEGYVLNAPKILLGQSTEQPNSGNFRLQQELFQPAKFVNWVIVYTERSERDYKDAQSLFFNMQKAGKAFGLIFEEPGYISVKSDRPEDYVKEINLDIKKNGLPLIVVTYIDRKQKQTCYRALKELLINKHGVPHQNIVKQSLEKNTMSVVSKIICQMSAKLKMPLWKVEAPKQLPENCMVVGIDIYHKLITNKDSCVGFVASINQNINQYYSRISITKQGNIFVDNIKNLLSDACKNYLKLNKKLPSTIIIYRDGVGDSQIDQVLEREITQILQVFPSINPDYQPEVAFILVNKMTNTKFFSQEMVKGGGRGDKGKIEGDYNNPQSGTVIISKIVSRNFDFFLAAQDVNKKQGTCTPTHYTIAYNDTKLPQDFFLQLTYFQTFNYFNWPGAVRVPACVMYAKKLCYLAGETFKTEAHENLDNYLFYL